MGAWNLFKSLIGIIQPQVAADREVIREGKPQNNMSGGQKWYKGLSSNGAPVVIDTAKTLQNVRAAFHESPQARMLVTRPRDLTIDTGLKLEPTPAWDQLGITDDDFKEAWIRDHEERFDIYMNSKQCHRSGTMTGYQLQRMYSLFDNRDNDQFCRFYYSKDRRLMSPVQLELIDPTQIMGCSYTGTQGFQDWRDGIKRDISGREIAYRIRVRKKVGQFTKWETVVVPAYGVKSGKVMMIHGYEAEYAGQGRGYSRLHYALQNFENIVDYVSAQVKKAINQSDMVGFVKPSNDAPASNPWEGQQAGPSDDPVVTANEETGEFECVERSEYMARVPGSDFIANLQSGESLEMVQDTAPGPQFDAFITSIFSHVSAARGYPFEVILMAFNSNYSASRAALLEAWRTGRISQADVKADLLDPWWMAWLGEEIAAGRTSAPGWFDPRLRQAWARYRLQGPPLPAIDPGKDLAAIEKKLKLHLTTQDREARNLNGSDAKSNIVVNRRMFEESPPAYWEDEPQPATEPTESEDE